MKRSANVAKRASAVIVLCGWGALGLRAQTLTTLYSFDPTKGVGFSPQAGLVQVTNGGIYGTAAAGSGNRGGTVFNISTSGTLTTLYGFSQANCADGNYPLAGIVQATHGALYGTTYYGGYYYGTVFKITRT